MIPYRNDVLKRLQKDSKEVLDLAIKTAEKVLNEATSLPVQIPLTGNKTVDAMLTEQLKAAGWKVAAQTLIAGNTRYLEVE